MQHLNTLIEQLKQRGLMLCTAESCTGGLLAKLITDLPGTSAVFERGFVTYSNASKNQLLGVGKNVLERYGAVSEEVAREMASRALKHAEADIAVSITGIAGPDGGTAAKPVGTVFIATAYQRDSLLDVVAQKYHFDGNRGAIRTQSAEAAIDMLLEAVQK